LKILIVLEVPKPLNVGNEEV